MKNKFHGEKLKAMINIIKKLSTARIIAMGFALLILTGSLLLMLPCSVKSGANLTYTDALYTSASAVCVTGLIAADAGDTFTALGQFILAMLIQIGGLGVTTMGAGIILVMGKRVNIKGRLIIRETMNVDSGNGLVKLIRRVFAVTAAFETMGALLSFCVFSRDYPWLKALGISFFHSIAAFNNAGFDILGNNQNLIPYQNNVFLNIVTCILIFFGGIGFLVICDMGKTKFRWKKLSMHSKVVLSVSAALLASGTILIKLTEKVTWLGAFFFSVSARTAGFSTYPLSTFSKPGLITVAVLMFIGASPGSTGGGIKTSTFFVLLQGIKSAATNHSEKAFNYSIPKEAFRKAAIIAFMAMSVIIAGTYIMCVLEPDIAYEDIMFEVISAFATVGLSTGITSKLCVGSKILSVIIMYIGRLGPLTIATLWHFSKGERVRYPDGDIAIG